MFISLNKKIVYTISLFFLLTSIIFLYSFYIVYGNKIQEEQETNIKRNQQYIALFMENISLSKELQKIIDTNKNIHIDANVRQHLLTSSSEESQITELSREQMRVQEMQEAYNARYNSIQEGIKIVFLSALLIALSIILLWAIIRRWILYPISKLTNVSNEVAQGHLNARAEIEKSPIFHDELDNLTSTFNQMLDKLEQVIAEVKEKEAFMQSLIDSIPDGIRVIDDNYNIVITNKAYNQQIINSKKCAGAKCYKVSQKLDTPCPADTFLCPLHEILNNKAKNIKVVQQFASNPGRHLSINAAPLIISKNERYIVESIRDLSEDINFSHQQKLSSLGFLASSVAHEMKNNLGAIRIIIERLLNKYYADKPADNEQKKHLELIYTQLVDSINVPERLLKLSRSTDINEDELIDCASSISDVISLLDFEAKSRGAVIDFQTSAPNLCIRGAEANFKMVIVNLMLNALNALKDNGHLQIDIRPKGSKHILITVADNGIGIEADKLHRIFEPFYSNGKNSQSKGTGLGLSIVKSIMNKFNAKIEVESTPGKGTVFTLIFPAAK